MQKKLIKGVFLLGLLFIANVSQAQDLLLANDPIPKEDNF